MKARTYLKLKRLMDIALCILLLPPFLLAGLVLLPVSCCFFGKRIFFLQDRLGYQQQVFRIYKFTTLLPEQVNGQSMPLAQRLTGWGSFMRNYSLDELPQLINILKGDMSFIGPRPLLPEYEALYTEAEARRHQVKPGLSGLAQINGRNALSWEEKMYYDQQYVANFSLKQDISILFKTIRVLFKGQENNHGASPAAVQPGSEASAQPLSGDLQWEKS